MRPAPTLSRGIGHVRSDDWDVSCRALGDQNGGSTKCHNHADIEPHEVICPSAQALRVVAESVLYSDVLIFHQALLPEPFAASFRHAQCDWSGGLARQEHADHGQTSLHLLLRARRMATQLLRRLEG